MIKKVALVQALREAFPNDLNNLYTEEEQGDIQMPMVDTTPIEQPKPVQQNFQQPVQQQVIEQDIDLGDSLV